MDFNRIIDSSMEVEVGDSDEDIKKKEDVGVDEDVCGAKLVRKIDVSSGGATDLSFKSRSSSVSLLRFLIYYFVYHPRSKKMLLLLLLLGYEFEAFTKGR